jgi:hypothetical protein
MIKKVALHALLILAVTSLSTSACANPLINRPLTERWQLDVGASYFVPGEKFYDENFDHGINGRISLTYIYRAGILLGVNYRASTRPSSQTAGVDLSTHLLGLKLGRDFLAPSNEELSVGFMLYLAYARVNGGSLECTFGGSCLPTNSALEETGIGFGMDLTFARQLGRTLGLGLEIEYNSTWINTLTPSGEFGNVGGLWAGPFLRIRL